jgi:CheY-like chemotaxis protein
VTTSTRPRVLVVEDDVEIRESLVDMLDDAGFAASGAANGRLALDYLAVAPPPSLIILDLMMPVMDGAAFRLRQLADPALALIPVVVITAARDPAACARALRANHVLAKPLQIDRLLQIARTCV